MKTDFQIRFPARITLLLGVLLITMGMALATEPPAELMVITSASARWADCPGMPPGCKTMVLYGDTAKTGEFAAQFKYVAGYRIGPHTHAVDEHATVISGGPFHVAVGDTFDGKAPSGRVLHVGDFVLVPAGTHHFAWAEGETVLQVNGIGPFKRNFLNPEDNGSGVPK